MSIWSDDCGEEELIVMIELGELSNSIVEQGLLFLDDEDEVSEESRGMPEVSDFTGLTSSSRVCLVAILSL